MERKRGEKKRDGKERQGAEKQQPLELGPWRAAHPAPPAHCPPAPPPRPHRPSVGLSSLPHQPHSWLCKHSWQVRKRSQLRQRGSECTLQSDRHGGHIRAQPPPPVSTSPSLSQGTWITPVVPASAAAVGVPGQVSGKQEAGVGGLAPGALARVGQAVITGQAPRGKEEGPSPLGWPKHTSKHPLPGPPGLTGCRVGDTPLGSSGHPGPGPAGCMPHPLCGWCSDATHRRGPGG